MFDRLSEEVRKEKEYKRDEELLEMFEEEDFIRDLLVDPRGADIALKLVSSHDDNLFT